MHNVRLFLQCAAVGIMGCTLPTAQTVTTPDPEDEIAQAIEEWESALQSRFHAGDSLAQVEAWLSGKWRDRVELPLGGTGARWIDYRIDDAVEIHLSCDIDVLSCDPTVGRATLWLRRPDGTRRRYLQPDE